MMSMGCLMQECQERSGGMQLVLKNRKDKWKSKLPLWFTLLYGDEHLLVFLLPDLSIGVVIVSAKELEAEGLKAAAHQDVHEVEVFIVQWIYFLDELDLQLVNCVSFFKLGH